MLLASSFRQIVGIQENENLAAKPNQVHGIRVRGH
jgi:hypothetical protein